MVVLINLGMLGLVLAIFAVPVSLWKISKNEEFLYAKAVKKLVDSSRDAVQEGDLAARDRYNYALTALVSEKDGNERETFRTDEDDPLSPRYES